MSKKQKTAFVCTDCGADYATWLGQCSSCKQWNTVKEVRLGSGKKSPTNRSGYAGSLSKVQLLSDIDRTKAERLSTGISELDRVLGGGIVLGSVVLIGGAPGAGKSTILLQALANAADNSIPVLYVSGEESPRQIAERAHRLHLPVTKIKVLAETAVEAICDILDTEKPQIVVID